MFNPYAISKSERNARLKYRCVHYHNGINHPICFNKDNGITEKIGFADIEASNLNATFGLVYTYCIKELDGGLISHIISLKDLYDGIYDKNLIQEFIDDTKKFDRIVWHYGTDRRFDVPFLRSRAVLFGLPFPEYKFLSVSDTYPILKNKFKLHSNRLEVACDFFGIPAKKHKLSPKIWLKMITGNQKLMKEALDYILIHNIEDVLSLEKLWKKISKFVKLTKTSI